MSLMIGDKAVPLSLRFLGSAREVRLGWRANLSRPILRTCHVELNIHTYDMHATGELYSTVLYSTLYHTYNSVHTIL